MQDAASIEARRHPIVFNSSELESMLEGRQPFRHSSLGGLLVQEKIITQAQLDDALAYQRRHPDKKLGSILAEKGAATSPQIYLAVARSLGAPIEAVEKPHSEHPVQTEMDFFQAKLWSLFLIPCFSKPAPRANWIT